MADVNSQDILNLANAYACIRANSSLGNGYKINDCYGDGILIALRKTVEKYKQKIEEADHEKH